MFHVAANIAKGVVGLLWPPACAGCGTNADTCEGLCRDCADEMLRLTALPYCGRCGSTIGPNIPVRDDGCDACPAVMFRFERVVRLGPYAGPLRFAIRQLKYRGRETEGRRLAAMLAEAVAARCDGVWLDVVCPVPMHWLRRLSRGWNHSAALADVLARRLSAPCGDELVRIRNTPPQVRMPASRRAANVRGAFIAARPGGLDGAGVLLVDDVTTTGATANEAARACLAAGARRVVLAVLAKAEPPTAYSAALDRG